MFILIVSWLINAGNFREVFKILRSPPEDFFINHASVELHFSYIYTHVSSKRIIIKF
jgi:hypothetical protein